MRAFILISCFSVALARPEAGYAYNAPSHGGVGVGGFSSGIISGSHSVGLVGGHSGVGVGLGLGGSGSYSTVGHQNSVVGSGLAGGFGSGLSGGFVGGHGVGVGVGGGVGGGVGAGGSLLTAGVGDFGAGYASGFGGGSTATIQKHIYVHVPPPEPEDLRPRVVAPLAQPQKHYKIIFIKAPSAPSYNPQVFAPHVQHEEKTLIYVLAKKPDEPQDIVVPTLPPTPPSKPEVYFIKYKTHKENVGGGLVGGGLVGGVVGGAEGAGLGVGLGGSALGVGIGHGVGSVAGLDAGIGGTTGHGVTGHGATGAGVIGIGSSSSHSSGVHSAGVSISSSHSSEISHGSDVGTGIGLDVRGAGPTGTPAASYGPPGKSGPY